MTSPRDVAAFHRQFDRHPDDRVRLFAAVAEAVAELLPSPVSVLYPGSYVDIGPSIWFDDVTYVDVDKRAARFFTQDIQVAELIGAKRQAAGAPRATTPTPAFHHGDYRHELPIDDGSIDLLISLYAGFISEHCTRYLRPGGLLLVNNSHGDAPLAALDGDNELIAVIQSDDDRYRVVTSGLDAYLQPKRGTPPTADELHETGRGVAYTKPAFAYLFQHRRP